MNVLPDEFDDDERAMDRPEQQNQVVLIGKLLLLWYIFGQHASEAKRFWLAVGAVLIFLYVVRLRLLSCMEPSVCSVSLFPVSLLIVSRADVRSSACFPLSRANLRCLIRTFGWRCFPHLLAIPGHLMVQRTFPSLTRAWMHMSIWSNETATQT